MLVPEKKFNSIFFSPLYSFAEENFNNTVYIWREVNRKKKYHCSFNQFFLLLIENKGKNRIQKWFIVNNWWFHLLTVIAENWLDKLLSSSTFTFCEGKCNRILQRKKGRRRSNSKRREVASKNTKRMVKSVYVNENETV